MNSLKDLYPSVFKMIRARAKLETKVRFEKKVHILITNKLKKDLNSFFKVCQGHTHISPSLFPKKLKIKNREKIFKQTKKGRKYKDILDMVRKDRAIIPLSKIERLTKWFCSRYKDIVSFDKEIFPIVQTFIENKIYDYTLKLLDFIQSKNKKMIRTVYVEKI